MPSALDAARELLQGVKDTFGAHGELGNPEHPLAPKVANFEAALAEMTALSAERPATEPPQTILNPRELKIVIESPAGEPYDLEIAVGHHGITSTTREKGPNGKRTSYYAWPWLGWLREHGVETVSAEG